MRFLTHALAKPSPLWAVPAFIESLESRRLLSGGVLYRAGTLDESFADRGRLTVAADWAHRVNAMVVQPDGKLLVVGETPGALLRAMLVARYHPDGSPDLAFGTAGQVIIDATANNDAAWSIGLFADGSILVAGGNGEYRSNEPATILLARYTSAGVPDSSFGTGGVVRDPYSPFAFRQHILPTELLIQPDGRVIVAGVIRDSSLPQSGVFMRRYGPDGALDLTYGAAGEANVQLPGFPNQSDPAIGLQPDGKLVIVTQVSSDRYGPNRSTMRRYDTSGLPDPTFTTNELPLFIATDLAVATSAGVFVSGYTIDYTTDSDFTVLGFHPDGAMNAGFGRAGRATINLGVDAETSTSESRDTVQRITVDASGSIIAAGVTTVQGNPTGVARFNTNGAPDRSFARRGRAMDRFGQYDNASVRDVHVAPDGAIIVLSELLGGNLTSRVTRFHGQTVARFARVAGRTLRVTGTRDADEIVVTANNGMIDVSLNGVARSFALTSISKIVLKGRGGDDVLTVDSAVAIPAAFYGGPGDDRFFSRNAITDVLIGGPGGDAAEMDMTDVARSVETFLP